MNLYTILTQHVIEAAEALQDEGVLPNDCDLSRLSVEQPRDASHGDMATNAAMVLAKPAGMNPRALAEAFAAKLSAVEMIDEVSIAGPGFINLKLSVSTWHSVLKAVLMDGLDFGKPDPKNTKINIEYVSANPTGPMHVGHCRGAVVGDALASLLSWAGYAVTREYYINDAGAQVDVLARSAYLRYCEALGDDIGAIPEGLYPGEYLKPVGQALAETHGDALKKMLEAQWLPIVKPFAIDAMMTEIKKDLALLNIQHDVFFSEASLRTVERDRVQEAIKALDAKGLIYQGRLEPPKGKLPDDWEDREQTLFRSSQFGDDTDRALLKSDGSYTYFASDVAYHYDKVLRGYNELIDVMGADHGGYVKRIKATVAALSDEKANLDVKLCQLVKLMRGGEQVKMSKRGGTFITLSEVVEEVGSDVVRFIMLTRKNDIPLDFDFAKVTEKSKDNPVFYVQYAHARAASVLRNAPEQMPDINIENDVNSNSSFDLLTDEFELALIKRLALFPELAQGAAHVHEPHRLAFYLYDLAGDLHALWNRGKDSPQLRFITPENRTLTIARLGLIGAAKTVIAAGLGILGVSSPEEMRYD